MPALEPELVGHIGDHEGLTDGLSAGNAQRRIAKGVAAVARLDKDLTVYLVHGAQYRLVADAAPPKIELKHHLFGGAVFRCRHRASLPVPAAELGLFISH